MNLTDPHDNTIYAHEDAFRAVHRNQFAPRNSGLPVDYYRESWWTRFAHRLCFWIPAVGLIAALFFRW